MQIEKNTFPKEWYSIATEEHFWMKWRLGALLLQLSDIGFSLTSSLKGLEVGSGCGVLHKQLEKASSWIIDGVDLDETALKKEYSKKGKTFIYDINERRTELKDSYDFIILFDVLEHIENEDLFIESVLFHLKEEGHLFINVPALNVFYSNFDRSVGHKRRYDKSMIKNIFIKHNCIIENMRYWGMSMLPLLFLRKLVNMKKEKDTSSIIKNGFKPPNRFFDYIIKKIMSLELSLLRRPFLGTSLLVAIKKKKG